MKVCLGISLSSSKIEITYSVCNAWNPGGVYPASYGRKFIGRLYQVWGPGLDDNTGHDPVSLIDTTDLARVILIAQNDLEENQISTFNQQSRQVTPVNLMHLTDVDWKRYFDIGWV